MSSNLPSVIKEFSWCENADQKVGAMASEIIYLRMHVKVLQEKLEQKLQGPQADGFYPFYSTSTSIEGDKE